MAPQITDRFSATIIENQLPVTSFHHATINELSPLLRRQLSQGQRWFLFNETQHRIVSLENLLSLLQPPDKTQLETIITEELCRLFHCDYLNNEIQLLLLYWRDMLYRAYYPQILTWDTFTARGNATDMREFVVHYLRQQIQRLKITLRQIA